MDEQRQGGSDEKLIIWWKDLKFLSGLSLVSISVLLGFVAKGIIFVNITKPIRITMGVSLWIFSWLLLLAGVFLIGKETVKIIQQRINLYIKNAVVETYGYTVRLPKQSIHYTRKLHKKSMDTLKKSFTKRKKED